MRRAVASSGQPARIAQTAVLGRGVKPSPVPEPQSLTNSTSRMRAKSARASAICPKTHSRAETGPKRDVVLLNAAASLIVADKAATLRDGVALAARSLDGGAALDVLRKLRAAATPPPQEPPPPGQAA